MFERALHEPWQRRRIVSMVRSRLLWTLVTLAAGLAFVDARQARREATLVVANGTVITMDAARRVIPNGAVAVVGADIVAVDTADAIAKQFTAADTIDAAGDLILP